MLSRSSRPLCFDNSGLTYTRRLINIVYSSTRNLLLSQHELFRFNKRQSPLHYGAPLALSGAFSARPPASTRAGHVQSQTVSYGRGARWFGRVGDV